MSSLHACLLPLQANFEMNTELRVNQEACIDILKNVSKNRRHYLKKEYFDKVHANQVSIKSPVANVTDAEWQSLVKLWSSEKHKVNLSQPLL